MVELLIVVAITLILMIVVFNFYNLSKLVYSSGLAQQSLQDGVNIVLSKIIEGKTEPSGVYRLAEGTSYCIGTGVACSGPSSIAELHFWGIDGTERWYKLDNTSTELIYHHPTVAYPSGSDDVIYTTPKGSILTLRFWVPNVANYPAAVVGMDVALTQSVFGRTVTGDSTTIVNLRNHP